MGVTLAMPLAHATTTATEAPHLQRQHTPSHSKGAVIPTDANSDTPDSLQKTTGVPQTISVDKETKKPHRRPVKETSPPPREVPSSVKTTPSSPLKTEVPSRGTAPEGATARCKDGSFSHSQQHRGACSRHGGVDAWLDNE